MKTYHFYICPICNKKFSTLLKDSKYCSRKCMGKHHKKFYKNRVFNPEWCRKISISKMGNKASLGKKLSQKHKEKLRDIHLGERNPMWKGGITRFITRIRQLSQYREWKNKILQRDYPNLTSGDIKKRRIQVHHLKAVNKIIQENNITTIEQVIDCPEFWDINNGVVIKKGEHLIITQIDRIKYPTKAFLQKLNQFCLIHEKESVDLPTVDKS